MTEFVDRCKFYTQSTGTGDFVVNDNVYGYLTPADADAVDGELYSYVAETLDGLEWEIGQGTYTAATASFNRSVIKSSNSDALVNFSTPPVVGLTILAQDMTFATDTGVFDSISILSNGTASSPAIYGPDGQGFHFLTNKVAIDVQDSNIFRIGYDDVTVTNDTFLIVGRTTSSPGHGYPQLVLRNVDQTTPDGAGGFIRFQSYNDTNVLCEAQINAGLIDATTGSEDAGYDFGGQRNGSYETLFAISAWETMSGPTVDNIYDSARNLWRWKTVYSYTVDAPTVQASSAMSLKTNSTLAVTIDTSQRVVIGHTAAISIGAASTTNPRLQIHGTDNSTGSLVVGRWSADASPATISFFKSRGAAVGTRGGVAISDGIGSIIWYGDDGTNAPASARIRGNVDATPGLADSPGCLIFDTTPDGSTTLTERMRISSSGLVSITGSLSISAGTTSVAPLNFTSGTNLTTAAAGAVEYDGKVAYFSHVASSRGVLVAKQIATVQGSAVALTNNITSAQSIFAAANDTLILAANTSYRFKARLVFNTGSTSHTTAFGLGGTATFTSIHYNSLATSSAADTLATPQMRRVSAATASILTAASTAVTTDILLEGVLRINGAGTIIPQVTFSAGPTGTCETAVNSFFEIEPIGTDTVAAIGNWS